MSELEIRVVDVFDDAETADWYAVHAASQRFGREEIASVWTLPELRVMMQTDESTSWKAHYVGLVDDEVVVVGHLDTPLLDNLSLAYLSVDCAPPHRRRGHGTALLHHLEAQAARRGRTVLVTETHWPITGAGDGSGALAVEFLRGRGFELGLVDVKRLLRLPVDESHLDELAADAADRHGGYTFRSWAGPVPDELLQGWADLVSTLMTEAPMGAIEREAESADVAVVRENEEILAKQGRTKYNTVALDRDGAVVGYTEVAVTSHEPDKSYQWGTLVRRADRGHGLGLALKVANLRLLQQERPDVSELVTWNAEVNSHMVAVNDLLGFEPIERMGEFQKRLA